VLGGSRYRRLPGGNREVSGWHRRGTFSLRRAGDLVGFKAVNDGSVIYVECGVEVLTFKPGHISMNAHGLDEYLPLDQFREAVMIYAKLVWSGVERLHNS